MDPEARVTAPLNLFHPSEESRTETCFETLKIQRPGTDMTESPVGDCAAMMTSAKRDLKMTVLPRDTPLGQTHTSQLGCIVHHLVPWALRRIAAESDS